MTRSSNAPRTPGTIGAEPHDLKASKVMRILTIVIVVGLCAVFFLANPAGSNSGSSNNATSSNSSSSIGSAAADSPNITTSSSGERAVGDVEAVTVYHVIDGDTLYVHRKDGSNAKVRLVGMNCPESVAEDASRNTEEGVQASAYTKSLIAEEQTVWLSRDTSETDQYGRLLRYVWLKQPSANPTDAEIEEAMLNAILVENGYAQAKRYEPDTAYYPLFKKLGEAAIDQGKGVAYSWA